MPLVVLSFLTTSAPPAQGFKITKCATIRLCLEPSRLETLGYWLIATGSEHPRKSELRLQAVPLFHEFDTIIPDVLPSSEEAEPVHSRVPASLLRRFS